MRFELRYLGACSKNSFHGNYFYFSWIPCQLVRSPFVRRSIEGNARIAGLDSKKEFRCDIERSSTDEERSGVAPQDPIIRQSVVEGTSFVTPGRPLIIGSFDMLDSTRRLDVSVVVEPVSLKAAKKTVNH
jgi:hypothetical protein